MNCHLYGSKHGLPLHALDVRARPRTFASGVASSVAQQARISNDQLLVLSVISIAHRRGDLVPLRSHIDLYGHPVCTHLELSQTHSDYGPAQLPELVEKGQAPSHFMACSSVFGSCTVCMTDYGIDISWHGAKKGVEIEVRVYRALGDCRSPFDWYWRTVSTRESGELPRSVWSLVDGPGSIRNWWNAAE